MIANMKSDYIYEAEFISTTDEILYLNVDLGFGSWLVTPFETQEGLEKMKFGTKLLIRTYDSTHPYGKCRYRCTLLKVK